MSILKTIALLSVAGPLCLGVAGCQSDTGKEVATDSRIMGEQGLQSRDLEEMATKMAPDIVSRMGGGPTRVIITMKPVENHLVTNPTEDLTIYVHNLRLALNSSLTNDKFMFVENLATTERLQNEELGGRDPFGTAGRGADMPDSRLPPNFVLKGAFYEKRGAKSSYYLCTFQITDIHNGAIAWEGSYKVKTLN